MDHVHGRDFPTAAAARSRYAEYLRSRRNASERFVDEATAARELLLRQPRLRMSARR
jgi:hypothetical protein